MERIIFSKHKYFVTNVTADRKLTRHPLILFSAFLGRTNDGCIFCNPFDSLANTFLQMLTLTFAFSADSNPIGGN